MNDKKNKDKDDIQITVFVAAICLAVWTLAINLSTQRIIKDYKHDIIEYVDSIFVPID